MEITGDKISMWFEKGMWHFANEEGEEIAHNIFNVSGKNIDIVGVGISRKVVLVPSGKDELLVCSNKGNQATCWTKQKTEER